MFVHVGQSHTTVVIAQGTSPLFIKYVDLGGCHFDRAVSGQLDMTPEAAAMLRRHNGDRRSEQQDPEIARSVGQAIRPIVEKLAGELALCVRYHSVTFRGQPLARMVLGGGEASASLKEFFSQCLDLPCQLGDPLRSYKAESDLGRHTQWDVAAGLALREIE
jgi:type IV pilus assembly protein PilM